MSRPEFITTEQVTAWDLNIQNDSMIPDYLKNEPIILEVMRSGLWVAEELDKLGCDRAMITQLQFTHGQLCFGRDPWEQASLIVNDYAAGNLTIIKDE